jgi:L-threonylcarbamoyladenylate synthase
VSDLWRFGDPIDALVERLDAGGFLAVPTESSYALAADPRSAAGVEAIFRAKGRDRAKALPVVAADVPQLEELGVSFPGPLLELTRHWPAPLTLVAALDRALPASRGRHELAVRVPDHEVLRLLLRRLRRPLTATSANRSGEAPLLRSEELLDAFPQSPMTVVVGQAPGGAPSTLLGCDGGRLVLLRPGRYPWPPAGRQFSAAAVEISAPGNR